MNTTRLKPKSWLQMTMFAFVAMVINISSAFADAPIYTNFFSNQGAGGYDVVSYFSGIPVKGSSDFKIKWKDAEWLFSSQANLDTFNKDPEAYAPQYGGYCAWAASQGYLASSDPDVWSIVDGKLYLNYDKNIQAKWEPNKAEFIKLADKKFPSLVDAK